MLIWKNTTTLDGFDVGLKFTNSKLDADIALLGSKVIELNDFQNLKAIFRAGIGQDNVPEKEAQQRGIIVRYPSNETTNIIFEETAKFTCGLIFRMLYEKIGTIEPWVKLPRYQLEKRNLLVIGSGRIGRKVAKLMTPFLHISTFDIKENDYFELKPLIQQADCITIHIPKNDNNVSFIDDEKLSWMKDGASIVNTARGSIVDEKSLYNEIKSGRIKAAFDVFWKEPYEGMLKEFYPDGFFMTPHVASTCSAFLEGCKKDLTILINELKKSC